MNVRRFSVRKAPWGRRTASKDLQSQAHMKWDCKYHVVIVLLGKPRLVTGGLSQSLLDLAGMLKDCLGAAL